MSPLTQLIELIADENDLPFTPPFQFKKFTEMPYPATFSDDVNYLGDWCASCLQPHAQIEWIRIRPQYLEWVGRLVPPKVISCEAELIALLEQWAIPYQREQGSILVFG